MIISNSLTARLDRRPARYRANHNRHDSGFWYALLKAAMRGYTAALYEGIQVHGGLNLPPAPRIIAGNHPNVTDAFALPSVFPEQLHLLIQGDVFESPLFGGWLTRAGQIPVVRGQGSEAVRAACECLARGHSVAIFPEGKLNPDGGPCKVGTGAMRIALQSGAPIVPVGFYVPGECTWNLSLQRESRVASGRFQFRGRCHIQLGEAWRPSDKVHGEADYRTLRELTDRLMERINAAASQAEKASLHAERRSVPGLIPQVGGFWQS